ncbi:hypothetical protein [Streptomyces sp. NPDC048644]|uniref:hypothetical protein n=1 Tax=Streptomyces sp. NPDC048644 TaxID=3365582 RepID=UPI0037189FD7
MTEDIRTTRSEATPVVRNVIGSLIALVGATAAVWSPFRPWYDGRHGRDVRIEDLFGGLTTASAPLPASLLLPMAFAALLTLIGVALRARAVVAAAAVVVCGFTILWMIRQGQAAGSLTAGHNGLGTGVAYALGGGALLLIGALVMRGRPPRYRGDAPRHGRGRHRGGRHADGYEAGRYDQGRYGDGRQGMREPYPPEPWDPGRPPAQQWTPGPPGTPAGQGASAAPWPGPAAPSQDTRQPPERQPDVRAAQQHPTPPVQWAKDLRQHPEGLPPRHSGAHRSPDGDGEAEPDPTVQQPQVDSDDTVQHPRAHPAAGAGDDRALDDTVQRPASPPDDGSGSGPQHPRDERE